MADAYPTATSASRLPHDEQNRVPLTFEASQALTGLLVPFDFGLDPTSWHDIPSLAAPDTNKLDHQNESGRQEPNRQTDRQPSDSGFGRRSHKSPERD